MMGRKKVGQVGRQEREGGERVDGEMVGEEERRKEWTVEEERGEESGAGGETGGEE